MNIYIWIYTHMHIYIMTILRCIEIQASPINTRPQRLCLLSVWNKHTSIYNKKDAYTNRLLIPNATIIQRRKPHSMNYCPCEIYDQPRLLCLGSQAQCGSKCNGIYCCLLIYIKREGNKIVSFEFLVSNNAARKYINFPFYKIYTSFCKYILLLYIKCCRMH